MTQIEVAFWHVFALLFMVVAAASLHWLFNRVTAVRCPKCKTCWRTQIVCSFGDEEMWECGCGHGWKERIR